MEFSVVKVLGTSAHTRNAVDAVALPGGQPACVECVGAGAVLVPLDSADSNACERFYYRAPKPGSSEPTASTSPKGSPESASPGSGGHKLVRVNKAACVAASSSAGMVAVGEASGYLPRLLLYDLLSGECLSVLKDQHQFGVQHLRFSPSGQYLASLGTPQDGFLYVWSVANGQLGLQASNKCISEIRDLVWLNDNQLVTAGVRHVKLWTVGAESILSGRNILLKETLDQTFECAGPARGALNGGIVVGTTRGELYKMPEIQHLATVTPAQPIRSIVVMDAAFLHMFVSTQSHIYEFRDTFDAPAMTYAYGAAALLSLNHDVYFLPQDSTSARGVARLPASSTLQPAATEGLDSPVDYGGMHVSSNYEGETVFWRTDEPFVYCWSGQPVKMPFSDITVAYALAGEPSLMVGSLCGDLWLGGELFNAHNGPVTDAHQLGKLAITSGRDRCVQIWQRLDQHGKNTITTAPWRLAQTLQFTSPILKSRLCAQANGALALVCCAANKTAYCFSAAPPSPDSEGPIFRDAPKSLLLKGMPFDMAAFEDTVMISTNDKHVTVLDPFAEQEKVKLRWRVYNANAESVNATHMHIIVYRDVRYVLSAGSDKCVHLFSYPKGELVASQWGHGESISGLAWTGSEVLSAGDSIFVSSLKATSNAPRVGRPRSSTYTEPPPMSPTMPRLILPSGATQAISARDSSPPRKVFNTSPPPRPRSVSPQRMMAPSRTMPRSPSPTRERIQPARHTEPGTAMAKDKDGGDKQPALAYKPLRLATPTSQARNVAAAATAAATGQGRQDPTTALSTALQHFVEQPLSHHDTTKLKGLLVAALNKIDGFALAEELSERLCGTVEARIEQHLANAAKRL